MQCVSTCLLQYFLRKPSNCFASNNYQLTLISTLFEKEKQYCGNDKSQLFWKSSLHVQTLFPLYQLWPQLKTYK